MSKGHGIRDVLRICACVNLMTRAAGSPMRCFIDMIKMKIAVAVAEFSRGVRAFFGGQRRIVTAETKVVI